MNYELSYEITTEVEVYVKDSDYNDMDHEVEITGSEITITINNPPTEIIQFYDETGVLKEIDITDDMRQGNGVCIDITKHLSPNGGGRLFHRLVSMIANEMVRILGKHNPNH